MTSDNSMLPTLHFIVMLVMLVIMSFAIGSLRREVAQIHIECRR